MSATLPLSFVSVVETHFSPVFYVRKLYDKYKSNGSEDIDLSQSGMLLVFVEQNILILIFDLNNSTVTEG